MAILSCQVSGAQAEYIGRLISLGDYLVLSANILTLTVNNLVLSGVRLISSGNNLVCQGTGRFHQWIPGAFRRQTDLISG
jgi:hypothetical protein